MFVLLFQNENEILSLGLGFLIQPTIEAVKFLDQVRFPCFENEWVFAFNYFQHLALQIGNAVAPFGEVFTRWLCHYISLGVVAVFRKSFLESSLCHSNILIAW